MALPQLTDEQRKAALAKAAEARKARAELKENLKRGNTNLKEVLEKAETDEIIGKTKVSALLEALPKVGKVKAKEIMEEALPLDVPLEVDLKAGENWEGMDRLALAADGSWQRVPKTAIEVAREEADEAVAAELV